MTTPDAPITICPSCGTHSAGKFCSECGTELGRRTCGRCGAVLVPGARFCGACGRSVEPLVAAKRAESGESIAVYAPWAIAALLLVSVLGYFGGRAYGNRNQQPTFQSDVPSADMSAQGGGGAPPDIGSLSPRERADRLYDRIMRYAEEGKTDSIQFFAPMALASFEMLGALDLDARYDYGRVASETGHLEVATAQADTILSQAPTHLLGLALAARTATLRGDSKLAASMWKRFLEVREAELRKNLPEYQQHGMDIELATRIAEKAR